MYISVHIYKVKIVLHVSHYAANTYSKGRRGRFFEAFSSIRPSRHPSMDGII